ncbi:uncharacterized protein LOC110019042 [Phalaenopsis equestris]|uniref:uncharacterized protein LOC110019042 n=1 Tax=Phalaenopsis equestris TaxID=78828 RepID=UPI0009E5C489|nr:uncharacterized protein LOC110019042 [Phalaenopsis equestris]XP_020572223.1 uncharacterized protein LOC110019042 [Phalaenopsis equestris]XP_020572224.1 uncharacterized protein LOC110019042 [Phalaenopsis equestris]
MSAFAMLGELAWQVKHIIIQLFSVLRGVRDNPLSRILLDCGFLVLCLAELKTSSLLINSPRSVIYGALAAPFIIKKLFEKIYLKEGGSKSPGYRFVVPKDFGCSGYLGRWKYVILKRSKTAARNLVHQFGSFSCRHLCKRLCLAV